jgi:hypothetical protein
MVVLSNSKPDRIDEFNDWYSNVHVLDVLNKLDGFTSAQRFELSDTPGPQQSPYRYLVLYEVPEDKLDTAYEQIQFQRTERAEALAAGREPLLVVSDALDPAEFVSVFFSPLTPVLTPDA